MLKKVEIKEVPKQYQQSLCVNGYPVQLSTQKTGFGVRRLFICPVCGKRRTALYSINGVLCCRSCAPVNIYRARCNVYDEGGRWLIMWNMYKLMASVGVYDIKFPFFYMDYAFSRPKYMRHDKYCKIIKKVQALENMRFCTIFLRKRFTATEIKNNISDENLDRYDVEDIADYVLFGTKAEYYSVLNS